MNRPINTNLSNSVSDLNESLDNLEESIQGTSDKLSDNTNISGDPGSNSSIPEEGNVGANSSVSEEGNVGGNNSVPQEGNVGANNSVPQEGNAYTQEGGQSADAAVAAAQRAGESIQIVIKSLTEVSDKLTATNNLLGSIPKVITDAETKMGDVLQTSYMATLPKLVEECKIASQTAANDAVNDAIKNMPRYPPTDNNMTGDPGGASEGNVGAEENPEDYVPEDYVPEEGGARKRRSSKVKRKTKPRRTSTKSR